jgi:hypothetical protein
MFEPRIVCRPNDRDRMMYYGVLPDGQHKQLGAVGMVTAMSARIVYRALLAKAGAPLDPAQFIRIVEEDAAVGR